MHYILLFYLACPAFLANMIPIIAAKWHLFPMLDVPIDANRTFRKKPIFGRNKTWRGLIIGTVFAGVFAGLQFVLDAKEIVVVPALDGFWSWIFFGFLSGFGALIGDMIESFFKRQIGIKSGRPFLPFDQIDYILGFLIFTYPLVSWTGRGALFLLIFAAVANPIVNGVSYLLGIKKTHW